MEYIALYRKYRPNNFNEVAGQKIIVQTLKNVIKNNKLTHSYLFIGPRGTGKTSIAKIFAKTINCTNSKDGLSCEKCDNCISCNNNENIDIIEMDAASNNGVDEIREIKNHVTLMPSKSKYKVYIIDEVHMLTIEAFNALLKTLEEPPKHVIFILATTEPQKVPLTIKSRCQNFEFKLLSKTEMIERLKVICKNENIVIDDESLELIVKDSNGGLRDAISFLDQLNAFSDNSIKKEDVLLLNGRINENEIIDLVTLMINNNLDDLFKKIDDLEEKGKNFSNVCEDISIYLKNCLIKRQKNLNDSTFNELSKNQIIEIIYELNNCINDLKLTKNKRICFDLHIIRICELFNIEKNVKNESIDIKNVDKNQIFAKSTEKNNAKTDSNKEKTLDNTNENVIDDDLMNLYLKLTDARINNILKKANKTSVSLYKDVFSKLSSDIINLDQLKIINLLNDCEIKAGSDEGFVITTENNNLLYEIYNNYKVIENIFNKKMNKLVNICVINNDDWEEKRKIYIDKIKSKESFELIDDSDIIKEIEKKLNHSDFDDLLEIGEI